MKRTAAMIVTALTLSAVIGTHAVAKPAKAEKIYVGIGKSLVGMCWVDDAGKLQGMDYELLKAVDELLPQYEFVFEPTEFVNILVGIDSKKYDIAAHNYNSNSERRKRYSFSKPYLAKELYYLVTRPGDRQLNGIADLHGKKIRVSNGDQATFILEQYNKENGNPIQLVYSDASEEIVVNNLLNGAIDGFYTGIAWKAIEKEYGSKLRIGSETLPDPQAGLYYIFSKNSERLRDAVDEALTALIKDGTVARLALKFRGEKVGPDGI